MEIAEILQKYGRHLFSSPDIYIHYYFVKDIKIHELNEYCKNRCANLVLVNEKGIMNIGATGPSRKGELNKDKKLLDEILSQIPSPQSADRQA